MKATGRPTLFSAKVTATICERLASGESLREICRDEKMPGKRTVFRWLSGNPEFRHQYAQARESQAEAIADEILEISDDGTNDTQVDENGFERVNHDHIARSKLRVDSRKWLLSKLAPKKYGDQLGVTHVGELDIRVVIGGDAPPSQGMEGS